jgi:IS30 family transposase
VKVTDWLTPEQRSQAVRLRKLGWGLEEVARQVGASLATVWRAETGRYDPGRVSAGPGAVWAPAEGRLTFDDRVEISVGLRSGDTLSAIARRLGRVTSTVSREVAVNGGRDGYRAWGAHCRAYERARRPKPTKLSCKRLASRVTKWLGEWWSPQEIADRLREEYPGDPMMWVSHETIYKTLYVQGRGELRRELTRCLRTGRAQRKPRGTVENRGHIPGMVMISERPADVQDRAVPGHWEGDLILGKDGRSAVGTLVERATRYVLLLHLPNGRGAEEVDKAMRRAIKTLPSELFRTITWDQGKEMSRHAAFTIDTGVQVYFCDPASPWQRGSNENTNGLLRQYMPKGTDLSVHSAADLARFARSLNNRPRKTLGVLKPSEKLAEFLAHTG